MCVCFLSFSAVQLGSIAVASSVLAVQLAPHTGSWLCLPRVSPAANWKSPGFCALRSILRLVWVSTPVLGPRVTLGWAAVFQRVGQASSHAKPLLHSCRLFLLG